MGYTTDLIAGVASYLEAQGVGDWSPGTALATGTLIVAEETPQEPHRVITLTEYQVADDPALSDATIGLNVALRGDVNDLASVLDMRDAVYDALHGLEHITVGASGAEVRLNLVWRQSQTKLAPDENGRRRRSENYYIRVNRPHPRLE